MTRDDVQRLLRNQRSAVERGQLADAIAISRELERRPEDSVVLWTPLPPSWNRVFKARAMPLGGGRFTAQVYKSKDAKEYAAAVALECQRQRAPKFPKEVMLRFHSVTVAMERAGCDLDDRLKVYFDALNGVLFDDDEQVAEYGDVRRIVDGKRPGIQATFTPIAVDRYGAPT